MIPILFFVSGFTALVYQVLWLRELGLLFGNTAHAAATGLTVFFLGLALGGWFWGTRAPGFASPLRGYALLEVGVAVSALLYFWLIDAYQFLYAPLYGALADTFVLLLAGKSLLAGLLLLPAAFFMGGTLPLMGQHVVRSPGELGRAGTFLYGINTAGAASGAFAAGFFLPAHLGFRGSYLLAIVMTLAVAAAAWVIAGPPRTDIGEARAGRGPAAPRPRPRSRAIVATVQEMSPRTVGLIATASGVLTLALEVAWIRMFAQVLANSVYSFATILVLFLVALALGAGLANRLCRLSVPPRSVLVVILLAAGATVALTPWLFVQVTDGLRHLGSGASWPAYLRSVFAGAAAVMLVPGVLIGAVFPYLLRAIEQGGLAPGTVIGRLVALNTSGAIAGALLAGFVLLGLLGLWATIHVLAAGYFLLALALVEPAGAGARRLRSASVAGLVGLGLLVASVPLPVVHVDAGAGERLVATWNGHHGVVAVVEQGGGRRLKLNNFYALGGTVDRIEHEQIQGMLPLLLHDDPRAVFFLGMGTGITAGESLRQPVERVVVAELIGEVVDAARAHFWHESNGLFVDPRVHLIVEDGRSHLAGTRDLYDVIVGDLFVPWQAGTGSLYTREHFRAVRQRLRPGGIFVQWLPLFQLTEEDFAVIARTMVAEFPSVVLWRADFYSTKAVVGLAGFDNPGAVLDPGDFSRRAARLGGTTPGNAAAVLLPFYAGNLRAAASLLGDGPLNADDRPIIEYRSPRAEWRERQGEDPWFYGFRLLSFFGRLFQAVPPEADPYLARLSPQERDYVRAGLDYYRAIVNATGNREEEARRALEAFLSRMPAGLHVGGPFIGAERFVGGMPAGSVDR